MQLPAKREKKMAVEIPQGMEDVFNVRDNMEGIVPRLPQIGIIHAGQLFEMPDEQKIPTFEGVILDHNPANAYWAKDIKERDKNKKEPPDCSSLDGVKPVDECENKQAEFCKDCPQNQWFSDPKGGPGKACKNMHRLMILMEDSVLPRRLSLSPASLGKDKALFPDFMTRLYDQGLPCATVIVDFSLISAVNADGFEYSKVTFAKNRIMDTEELLIVGNLIKQYKEGAREQEIQADEYAAKESESEVDEDEEYGETSFDSTPPPKKSWFGKEKEPETVSEGDIPF